VYVAGTTVGGLTGRLVAGPLAELVSWRMAVFAVAVLCAVASVLFLRLIPPSRRPAPAVQPHELRGLSAQLGRHFRSRRLLVMLAQALLLMGGFVAMYNFVGFRLSAAPFELPPSVVSLVFLAYLAGTWSSVQAGVLAARWGRLPVLIVCTAVMIIGVCATTLDALVAVLIGIVLTTLGFFGAHSIASEWVGHEAIADRAQASSLYNLLYYAGSSLFGWFGGVLYASSGWPATAGMIMFLAFAAGLMALSALRGPGPAELQQARRDRG
jgi:predicted MFS family arabinose efflux permease